MSFLLEGIYELKGPWKFPKNPPKNISIFTQNILTVTGESIPDSDIYIPFTFSYFLRASSRCQENAFYTSTGRLPSLGRLPYHRCDITGAKQPAPVWVYLCVFSNPGQGHG